MDALLCLVQAANDQHVVPSLLANVHAAKAPPFGIWHHVVVGICIDLHLCSHTDGKDLFESFRHSSSQSSNLSLLVFVLTCFSAATRTGNDLFVSFRHSSSQYRLLHGLICLPESSAQRLSSQLRAKLETRMHAAAFLLEVPTHRQNALFPHCYTL
jgi:hypothetical protein